MAHSSLVTAVMTLILLWALNLQEVLAMAVGAWLTRSPVTRVQLGTGPEFFKTQQGSWEFSARLWPFGGGVERKKDLERARASATALGFVLLFCIAFVIHVLVGALYGIPSIRASNVIGQVRPDSPAAHAGLQPGDRVLKVASKPTSSFKAIFEVVDTRRGKPTRFTVQRQGRTLEIVLTPTETVVDGRKISRVGIYPAALNELQFVAPKTRAEVFGDAWTHVLVAPKAIVAVATSLFVKTPEVKGLRDVVGPIGCAQLLYETTFFGLAGLLFAWAASTMWLTAFAVPRAIFDLAEHAAREAHLATPAEVTTAVVAIVPLLRFVYILLVTGLSAVEFLRLLGGYRFYL